MLPFMGMCYENQTKDRIAEAKSLYIYIYIFVALTACAAQEKCAITGKTEDALDGGETLAALRKRGTLRVGFSNFAPWALQDANGEWIGFELDVIYKITRDLNLEPELLPRPWGGIIDDLLNGEFDIIISGMSINPQRAERVTFSAPYTYTTTVLLLNQSIQINSLKELNQPQYRFVGAKGYSTLYITQLLFNEPQIEIFDDAKSAVSYLAGGQADAFLLSLIEAVIEIDRYPKRIYIPDWGRKILVENGAFALPKNVEAAWLKLLNDWIQTNWANGFLEQKNRYWMESRDWTKDHQLTES